MDKIKAIELYATLALIGSCYFPSRSLSLWGHQSEEVSLCSPTLIGSSWEMLGELSCTSILLQVSIQEGLAADSASPGGFTGMFWVSVPLQLHFTGQMV